jgi:hypothetical protein
MSVRQGDLISSLIERGGLPWNRAFQGRPVVVPPDGPLPRIHLSGGGVLTLLSPTWEELRRLRSVWQRDMAMAERTPQSAPGEPPEEENSEESLEEANLEESPASEQSIAPGMPQEPGAVPGSIDVEALAQRPFREDASVANGSSIAFLAEIEGRSLLIGGDARARVLVESIKRLLIERRIEDDVRADEPRGHPRLPVSLFVVPRSGSRSSVSKGLLELIACDRYVFATSSDRFRRPDQEAIARIIAFGGNNSRTGPRLIFNYRSTANSIWDDKQLQARYRYEAIYPEEGRSGIRIRL